MFHPEENLVILETFRRKKLLGLQFLLKNYITSVFLGFLLVA